MIFDNLRQFRQSAYECLGKARDALFDLMDAVLVTPSVSSLVQLSCSPVFRRQWSSIYTALRARPHRQALRKLYVAQVPTDKRPLLAGDHTAWPRLHAVTLKERTFEHHPSPITSHKPITIGQGYSTLAWVPEEQGSWALPLCHERITSFETPLSKAAFQLGQVCRQLAVRPLSVWDSEYANASFVKQTAEIEADKLMRIRPNRCLWGPPPPYAGRGRPRLHGAKFKLSEPSTWGQPEAHLTVSDPQWGEIHLQCWSQLHFRRSPHHPMSVLRIECHPQPPRRRTPKPMWLAWVGGPLPELESLWRDYLRRFAVDHWNRFAKQRLHWTLPQLSTLASTECWSQLMPLLSWQLWLARQHVADCPLPWQKPQPPTQLTPGRVAQAFPAVLAVIGTPAQAPKPRGKSPGWPRGSPRQRRARYPVVKKGVTRKRSTPQPRAQPAA